MNNQAFLQWLDEFSTHSSTIKVKPLIMGILNATPDSFSDGGRYLQTDFALNHAREMISAGADIIDIGGESSRPGALFVNEKEEIARVIPIIERLRADSDICISIDTYKPAVMKAAIVAGANMVNDITALNDEASCQIIAEYSVPVCLMHMQGNPCMMQLNPAYDEDVIISINRFFSKKIEQCMQAGITKKQLILDPGFGFGKSVQHNLWLTKKIDCFTKHGLPLLLGVSRKSTLGKVLNKTVDQRLIAGIAISVYASLLGVSIIRTHDVDETNQALSMIDAINNCN